MWSTKRARTILLGWKFLQNSHHKSLELSRKRIANGYIIENFKMGYYTYGIQFWRTQFRLKTPDLDKSFVMKGNYENVEDKILHCVETDVWTLHRVKIETRQDPLLSKNLERIDIYGAIT